MHAKAQQSLLIITKEAPGKNTQCCRYNSALTRGGSRNFIWGARGAEGAPRSSAAGARIEAPQVPRGVGCGEGCPLPTGGGVWGGPPPEKIFSILHYKMACFGRFWSATYTVDRCYRYVGGFNDRFWLTTDVKAFINCNIRCRHHYAFGGGGMAPCPPLNPPL